MEQKGESGESGGNSGSEWDGEKPILEYTPTGALAGQNIYGKNIDEILMRIDFSTGPARTYYYQDDHEGSVTHLTDASGVVVESYRYDAFGAPTINGGARTDSAFNNRFMFTGREYAPTFGIYEYRNRAYHPGLGRFMSEDPKGFVRRDGLGKAPDKWTFEGDPDEGELNLFRYCDNDPEDFTDPMGLDTYSQDRELTTFGGMAMPTGAPFTGFTFAGPIYHPPHGFVFTTNPDGSVSHTYSWGNSANNRGWNPDQREDIKAAKEGLKRGWAKREGDSHLDRYTKKAFDELNQKKNEHRNGLDHNNCQTEKSKLLDLARALQKQAQQQKRNDSQAPRKDSPVDSPKVPVPTK